MLLVSLTQEQEKEIATKMRSAILSILDEYNIQYEHGCLKVKGVFMIASLEDGSHALTVIGKISPEAILHGLSHAVHRPVMVAIPIG